MNVYVRSLGEALARAGVACDIYTRAEHPDQPPIVEVEPGFRVVHVDAGPRRPGREARPRPDWSTTSSPRRDDHLRCGRACSTRCTPTTGSRARSRTGSSTSSTCRSSRRSTRSARIKAEAGIDDDPERAQPGRAEVVALRRRARRLHPRRARRARSTRDADADRVEVVAARRRPHRVLPRRPGGRPGPPRAARRPADPAVRRPDPAAQGRRPRGALPRRARRPPRRAGRGRRPERAPTGPPSWPASRLSPSELGVAGRVRWVPPQPPRPARRLLPGRRRVHRAVAHRVVRARRARGRRVRDAGRGRHRRRAALARRPRPQRVPRRRSRSRRVRRVVDRLLRQPRLAAEIGVHATARAGRYSWSIAAARLRRLYGDLDRPSSRAVRPERDRASRRPGARRARADRRAPRRAGRRPGLGPDRRVRPRDPPLVRALRLRRARRGDDLLRPAPAHAALRGVLPPRPARGTSSSCTGSCSQRNHGPTARTSRSVPTATCTRRTRRCSSTSTSSSSTASSACSTSSSRRGSSPASGSRSGGSRTRSEPEERSGNPPHFPERGAPSCTSGPTSSTRRHWTVVTVAPAPGAHKTPIRVSGRRGPRPHPLTCWHGAAGGPGRRPDGGGAPRRALDAGWAPETIAVAEVDADRRRVLEERFPEVRVVPSPAWAVADADVVVLAVKPDDVAEACASTEDALPADALVVSLAAGVPIAAVEAARPRPAGGPGHAEHAPRSSATARPRSPPADTPTPAHLDTAEQVLGAVGTVVRLPEDHLDAVTGLSGSGPGLRVPRRRGADRGRRAGRVCPATSPSGLVRQTLLGAATLLARSDEPPEALRAAVTSPGGTTAAGAAGPRIERGVRAAFLDAVGRRRPTLPRARRRRRRPVTRRARSDRPPHLPDRPAPAPPPAAARRGRAARPGGSLAGGAAGPAPPARPRRGVGRGPPPRRRTPRRPRPGAGRHPRDPRRPRRGRRPPGRAPGGHRPRPGVRRRPASRDPPGPGRPGRRDRRLRDRRPGVAADLPRRPGPRRPRRRRPRRRRRHRRPLPARPVPVVAGRAWRSPPTGGPSSRSTDPRPRDEWLFAVGRPDLVVADGIFARQAIAAGLETVAVADLDAPEAALAAYRGRPVVVIPAAARPAARGVRAARGNDPGRPHHRPGRARPDPRRPRRHTPAATLGNRDPGALRCPRERGRRGVSVVAQSFAKARFLTVQEVADLMRVSSMTVYRLIKASDLPAVRVRTVVPGPRRGRRHLPRLAIHPGRLNRVSARAH